MTDIVSRRRAREHIETDLGARQLYDQMIAIAREVTGSDGDGWQVISAALTLALDVDQPPAKPLPPPAPGAIVVTRYHSINFPVSPSDAGLRSEEIQFKYALSEVLAWMRGGITVPELSKLGHGDAWAVISGWVDQQRRGTS